MGLMMNRRSHCFGLKLGLTAAITMAGCSALLEGTEEAYRPTENSFVFEGVEYPPSSRTWRWPRVIGPSKIIVNFEPTKTSNFRNYVRGPYAVTAHFRTESGDFDEVIISRLEIVLPETGEIIHLYRTPISSKLKFERSFWYAIFRADRHFSPDFDEVSEFYVVIEYEYRGRTGERVLPMKEVQKYRSVRIAIRHPFPTI